MTLNAISEGMPQEGCPVNIVPEVFFAAVLGYSTQALGHDFVETNSKRM
jgi:hypothetical protein